MRKHFRTRLSALATVQILAFVIVFGGSHAGAQPLPPPKTHTMTDATGDSLPDDPLNGFDPPATEHGELEDDLEGFDDVSQSSGTSIITSKPAGPGWLRLSGSVGLSAAYNLKSHRAPPEKIDLQGLSRLRGDLNLTADLEMPGQWKGRLTGDAFYDWIYSLRGRDNYTRQMLDAYEDEVRLGEAWIRGNLMQGLDVQVGRQIVVWGKSDNIRITDVINPLDMREPGMTDIEDLRLPVAMTRLDYTFDQWNLTGLVIHEIRFNELPEYGSDYYVPSAPLPVEKKPSCSLDNQEVGLALSGVFSGWDLSLYAARFFDYQAHLEARSDGYIERHHSRINMVGAAINVARANWLFKFEAAGFNGMKFDATPDDEYSRIDALVGVEFAGFTDLTISLEAANRHLVDYDDRLGRGPGKISENEFQWALRITRDFLHKRLSTTLLVNVFDINGEDSAFERLELNYEIDDHWELTAGTVLYQGGDNQALERIKNNDRLFVRLEYAF